VLDQQSEVGWKECWGDGTTAAIRVSSITGYQIQRLTKETVERCSRAGEKGGERRREGKKGEAFGLGSDRLIIRRVATG
jgi:hypothetical protein